jgi:hypothetical protein
MATKLGSASVKIFLMLGSHEPNKIFMNPTKTTEDSLRILLASIKMEAAAATVWWSENRDKLRKMKRWLEFSIAVKERFVPAT